MPTLQNTEIADMVESTLDDLGELKMTDIMSTYQNTIMFKRLVKKNKMTFDSGQNIRFNLITGHNDSARAVGLYYTAIVNPVNVLSHGSMPWRHQTFNWAIDRREIAMNRSPRKILDMVKVQRLAAFASAVVHYESRGWRVPASTDDSYIHGVPYNVVKSNTAITTNDGFNGSLPSGYSTVGGVDPTASGISPKWNNFALQYTAVSQADLVDKMWSAMDLTDFMPLVDDIPQYSTGDDYGIYTTRSVRNSLKTILMAQNENLGFDLDPANNRVAFRRTPVQWVKELDGDTTNPMYGLCWSVFHSMGLRDEWMKETVFPSHSNQPTVLATHIDNTMNFYCVNRRRNWVLATDTAMPA